MALTALIPMSPRPFRTSRSVRLVDDCFGLLDDRLRLLDDYFGLFDERF